jgi:sulfur carrier protein ThiS
LHIKIVLFGLYRGKLPREAHGEVDLDLPEGTTIGEVLARLEINMGGLCILNGQSEIDKITRLQDGDRLQIVPPVGGG